MFKLFRYYSIISLIAFLIVSILLGRLYRSAAENDLRAFAEKENIVITNAFASTMWHEFEPFLEEAKGMEVAEIQANTQLIPLYDQLQEQIKNTDIVKLKIFTTEGQVVFSTEFDEIGSFYDNANETEAFANARAGQPQSGSIVNKDTFVAFDNQLNSVNVFSSFVPISKSISVIEDNGSDGHQHQHAHDDSHEPETEVVSNSHDHSDHEGFVSIDSDEVSAIFEVYSDVTHLVESIDETQNQVTFGSLAMLGVLFVSLLWFVRRAEIVIRKNITDQKQAQVDKLEQIVVEKTADLVQTNAKLEETATLKDAFFANMSHELRTPLNMIYSRTQALQMNIYGDLTDKQGEVLKGIELGSTHLLSLINDILDVSKLSAGKVELVKESIDISHIIETSLALIMPLAIERDIHVEKQLSDNISTIFGDQRRIIQIIVNLLSNAVKFTPHDGSIGLTVNPYLGNKTMVFTVWDTGVGISPEDQEKLFSEFTQLDNRFSRDHNGTGLGLVLVKQLTEMHGGTVHLDSVVGEGSRFSVSIPWDPTLDSKYQAFRLENSVVV